LARGYDPTIIAGLPPEVEDTDGNKHSTVGAMQYPRADFSMIFLLAAGLLYCCAVCDCTLQFHSSIGNIDRHIRSAEHVAAIQKGMGSGGELDNRIFHLIAEIAFHVRPFRLAQSTHMAALINSPFLVTGTTARQLIVAAGICVQRQIQRCCADSQGFTRGERHRWKAQMMPAVITRQNSIC
jgi:hypothetical protein